MLDNNDKKIIVHYDLDEYVENIINGLSDEECQEVIDSVGNGYLSGIVTLQQIKKSFRIAMRDMMLNRQKEG